VYGYDGALPVAGLIAVNGAFYGTTEYGGEKGYAHGDGTVFRVGATGTETVLHSFAGSDGAQPVADLVAVNGILYGTTAEGGAYNGGTIFSLSTTGEEKLLHSFGSGSDGARPRAGLIAIKRRLYGTTYQGGAYGEGTVFSISEAGKKERVLHSFGKGADGSYPLAQLLDVNGMLYGTTNQGGAHDTGTVFTISPVGKETVLHSFKGPDGAYPYAGLIASSARLYGTTGGGGTSDSGTVFSISMEGTDERVLHSFSSDGSDGISPGTAVTMVEDALYGTTSAGGADSEGTVFRVTTSGTERVLHSFGESYEDDGIYPMSDLIYVNGTLYGTTYEGGINLPSCPRSDEDCAFGTVFALQP
jgi:uncharacterized repeat protein (TIGR03803 family)